jgi:hypothetical protein
MLQDVQRFVFIGKPRMDNRKYNTWESATVVVFVRDSDHDLALRRFYEVVDQHRWNVIRLEETSTLIKESVRYQGGDVWVAYQKTIERLEFIK